MPKDRELVSIVIQLPREQVTRLELLRDALKEKMKKNMTKNDLIEKIIADFLEK
jgi:hypothetical protein